jgi:hypothetical protein
VEGCQPQVGEVLPEGDQEEEAGEHEVTPGDDGVNQRAQTAARRGRRVAPRAVGGGATYRAGNGHGT